MHRTFLSGDSETSPTETYNIMATNSKNTSPVPAKVSQSNKSENHITTPEQQKKPLSSPQDKLLPSNLNPPLTPTPQVFRKRMNFIDLASPPKKGPGVAYKSDEPPNTTPTTTPMFNLATLKKFVLEPFIKLLEKEKKKKKTCFSWFSF
jgi:hypothetical protein